MNKQSDIDASVDACVEDLVALVQALRSAHGQGASQKSWLTLDLSMAQLKALMATLHHGALTSRAMADRLGIGPSAVTPLVDKLVSHKLVKREDDAGDRRVVWIKPTPKAYALQERLMASNRALMRELVEGVPAEQLATVQKGLALLSAAVKKRIPEPKEPT